LTRLAEREKIERSLQEVHVAKIVALVRRKDGMSYQEFVSYWQDHHAHVVSRLPGLRRYVQNPAQDGRAWPYDGMAELWFDDVDAIRDAFRSPQSDDVRADEPNFVDTIEWFIADEHPVLA
jgi:uncharacterized protein (TIGR02118 family)